MTAPTAPHAAPVDADRAAAFAERMLGVLDTASLALLISVGHRVGLFDAMADLGPGTSTEIATAAGLQERYVREWLGGATTGRIVEHDPDAGTYALPAEHATCLTRAAGPDNLAKMLQFVPLLAQVEDPIVDAFHHGGGVAYSAYPRFHALMAEESAAVVDATLLSTTIPLVEGLSDRLAEGIDVADIGCGSGHAINVLARAYPASRFVGYDFSEEAIAAARAEAQVLELSNVRFEVLDAAELDAPERFDVITAFDAIHDQAEPRKVLANIHRSLRTHGTFLMVDIKASSHLPDNLDIPWATFLYTVSLFHCMTVSLALGGEGLGTVWGHQQALGLLDDAGFADVAVHDVEDDLLNSYFVATKTPC